MKVRPARVWLAHRPRALGARQRQVLRRLELHGTLSARNVPQRQARNLARRGIVIRSDTGSVTLTVYGKAVIEWLKEGNAL